MRYQKAETRLIIIFLKPTFGFVLNRHRHAATNYAITDQF